MPKANTYRKRHTGIPINKKQITVIKLATGLLHIDDETYRSMLRDRYKVTSCTKLSYDQAGEFIRELEGKGFVLIQKKTIRKQVTGTRNYKPKTVPRAPIPRTGNVVALATRDELEKIIAVAALIEWRVEGGLQLFLEKRMGIKGGKVRTQEDSWKAIEGLKKMYENQMKAKHGPAWWCMGWVGTPVQDYVDAHCPLEWR